MNLDENYVTTSIMGLNAAKIHACEDIDYSDVFTYLSEDEILKAIGTHQDYFIESITLQAMQFKELVYFFGLIHEGAINPTIIYLHLLKRRLEFIFAQTVVQAPSVRRYDSG